MYIGTTVRSPDGTIKASVVIGDVEQPLYRRPMDGKVFVVGLPGEAYVLRVQNLTGGRVEVINTVDGRNTLKDEAGDRLQNSGLVFGAQSSGAFTGWRMSDSGTCEFVFGEPEHSIAAQATDGDTSNVGVIGFAVHRERPPATIPALHLGLGDTSSHLFGGATREASRGSLGTGMGAPVADVVGRTRFTRDGHTPDILVIGYDTESVLREMGVLAPAEPDAFPGVGTGYARYEVTTG